MKRFEGLKPEEIIVFQELKTIISMGGGARSAIAEVLRENYPVPMHRIGIKDVLGETATNQELLDKYGMSHKHIASAAGERILRKDRY